jgi:hypothetical protein
LRWAQEELRKGLADITVLDATAHVSFFGIKEPAVFGT